MFQPAKKPASEQPGSSPICAGEIAPDFAFSLHNMPGVPFGEVRLKTGVATVLQAACRVFCMEVDVS